MSHRDAHNSFENPDRVTVKPHEAAVNGVGFRIALPTMSLTTVLLDI